MITIQKAGKKETQNFLKRKINIKFFASLNRAGLSYQNQEATLPLYRINNNENISIRYPGKESVGTYPKPWDFRPILIKNNIQMKNLSFADIWNYINVFIKNENSLDIQKINLVLISRIFYKLAFLMCHDLQTVNGVQLYKFNRLLLSTEEQILLNKTIRVYDIDNNQFDISMESFIIYNDLLCANEDCKYFYKSYYDKHGILKNALKTPSDIINNGAINWEPTIGRINTALTHINVLKSLYDNTDMFHLLALSIQLRGIFNIRNDENLMAFLNQYIES